MILFVFYALCLIAWFCVLGVLLVLYIGFWLMGILVALVICIVRAIIERRKPEPPKISRPQVPQAKWSNRR